MPKLNVNALPKTLESKPLAPLYFLSGDEPLQLQEAADQIRVKARETGFEERVVFHVESGFDWSALTAEQNALSLFSSKKLVELRLPNGKPGKEGAKVLSAWAESPPSDQLLLVIAGKLEGSTLRTKWFQTIEKHGVTVQIWPIEANRFPAWVQQRMKQAGLQATLEAAEMLAARTEGNLLATAQEIEKLKLLSDPGEKIDGETVTQLVGDSARFNVFQLANAMLVGNAARAVRMIREFREEGVAVQVVLWAVLRDLRELAAMGVAQQQTRAAPEPIFAVHKPIESVSPALWKRRRPNFVAALQRIKPQQWTQLLNLAGEIDCSGKGIRHDDPWDSLERLVIQAV